MSSVQRAPEFPQADLQIMPDVAYPLMSGHNWLFGISLLVGESRQRGTLLWGAISGSPGREHGSFGTNGTRRNHMYEFQSLKI